MLTFLPKIQELSNGSSERARAFTFSLLYVSKSKSSVTFYLGNLLFHLVNLIALLLLIINGFL